MNNGIVVNIEGEDINKMIAQAILDSTLGDTVREAVQKAVAELGDSHSRLYGPNNFEKLMQRIVRDKITELMRSEYKDQVEALARNAIDANLSPNLVNRVIDKMLGGYD